jgi:protoporphyrinogen oxidase
MERLNAEAAQYLHARVDDAIPSGAWVVLRKRGDSTFELVIVTQANDTTDVTLLATFLDPADVDAIRDTSIASVVLHHKQKRSRRTKAG